MDGTKSQPPDPSTPAAEELLAGIIDLEPILQDDAFRTLCREHPALARELEELRDLHRRLMGPPDPSTSSGGERFGPFELVRPIGSGGMGTVWLARQRLEGMDREVALKMVRARGLFSTDTRERFRREARALFRVEHPGICPIYDVGEVDGTPYLAMRFIPGHSLAELIAEAREAGTPLRIEGGENSSSGSQTRTDNRARIDGVLSLIEAIARALHAAHEVGLVHRDVKPSNVIVTPVGDPVLLDFGLARASGEDSDLTLTGMPIGTPAYMSPEQVAGRHAEIDRTTDVWSLAVTLHECLTLETPFRAETREAMYRRILAEDPPRLRAKDGTLPKELEIVVATALRKEPDRRYRTALEFAEDLAAVRRHLPTRARRAGPFELSALWVRRNRAVSALLLLLAVALATSIALAVESGRRADEAMRSQQLAEDSFAEARRAIEETVAITRDELDAVPRFSAQRTRMLESAIRFYERFATLRSADPALASDVAEAWHAVGDIGYEIGRYQEAEAAFAKAIAFFEERRRQDDDGHLRTEIATIEQRLGSIAARFGRVDEGLARIRASIDSWRSAIAANPSMDSLRLRAQSASSALMNVLRDRGDLVEALAVGRQAMTEFRVDPSRHARGLETASRLIGIVAKLEFLVGELEPALSHFAEAMALIAPLVEAEDCDSSVLGLYAVQLDERAELFAVQNRIDDVIADRLEALEIGERLVALAPESANYRNNLGSVCSNLGAAYGRRGMIDEARTHIARARGIFEAMAADRGDDPAIPVQIAITWNALGDAEMRARNLEEGLAAFRACLTTLETIVERGAHDFEVRRLSARAWTGVSNCQLGMLEFEAAEAAFAAATTTVEGLLVDRPEDRRLIDDLARLSFNRGIAAEARDDRAAAARHYASAHDRFAVLQDKDANPPSLLLERIRAAARAALAQVFDDAALAGAGAGERLAAIEALPEALLQRAGSQSRFRRDHAILVLVHAIGTIREDQDAALRRLATIEPLLANAPKDAERDWIELVRLMSQVTLARLRLDDEAALAPHLAAIEAALDRLSPGEPPHGLPPFPDLAHTLARVLDGVDALALALPLASAERIDRATAKVRRRLAGE
ncbi:MAG: serine/threonine protein kinase [Planctomycetes bacterium]|nr:serine/threonine protein kinase [Planctomycetota bacterium]